MARLLGAQRLVLQAIHLAQGDTADFIEEDRISAATQIAPGDLKEWLVMLEGDEYIDIAPTARGLSVSLTPRGRLVLRQYSPPPSSVIQATVASPTPVPTG